MADGQQIGRLLLIQIGDGATPEVFTNLCGLQTRSFNMSANSVDTTIPDCQNPGATPQKTGVPGIKQRTFTGSGKFVAGANSAYFVSKVNDAAIFNAIVIVPGLGSYEGPWFVTDFEFSGEQEGNMDFSATFEAAGPLTFEAEVTP
ncbi:phage major tail protein, TP901-1 family [Ochrobactrum soli]|uniref:Phage major tail protein, TP901-1 family n=1 Tax=Ochrobactrum soli TaxID=2448455 RepID=A0A849KPF7_9HYPH|nr:phage major tail protein, TP901-1 family [[Ochrobactrum] soli]NNU59728.1 phage major tail protein, TP901-1 family [[Ochrobactrum] soli]